MIVICFSSNMLIFNGMFYDLFDKKRTIYIYLIVLFLKILLRTISNYSIIIRLQK